MKTIKAKVHRLPTNRAEKCVTVAHKQILFNAGEINLQKKRQNEKLI